MRDQRKLKVFMIFAYDIRGALTSHRVDTGHIMNDMCYEGYSQQVLSQQVQSSYMICATSFGGGDVITRAPKMGKDAPSWNVAQSLVVPRPVHVASTFL